MPSQLAFSCASNESAAQRQNRAPELQPSVLLPRVVVHVVAGRDSS